MALFGDSGAPPSSPERSVHGVSVGKCGQLWRIVDKLRTTTNAQPLKIALQQHRSLLLNPLVLPARNAVDRRAVENGEIELDEAHRRLPRRHVPLALELSDELQLNEVHAAAYVLAAVEQQYRFALPLRQTALRLFFDERRMLLQSLLSLAQARMDQQLPTDVRAVVLEFTNNLVREGLLSALFKKITSLSTMLTSLPPSTGLGAPMGPPSHTSFYLAERQLCALIAYFFLYETECSKADAMEMMDVFRDVCKGAREADEDMYRLATTLLMCVLCAINMENEVINVTSGMPGPNPLGNDGQFLRECDSLIMDDGQWSGIELGFRAVAMLGWGLFIHASPLDEEPDHIQSVVDSAVGNGVFAFIGRTLLPSSSFTQKDQVMPFFCSTVNELMSAFLVRMSDKVKEMKSVEEELARYEATVAQYRSMQNTTETEKQHHFVDLLICVTALYGSHPEFSIKFWDDTEGNALNSFVVFTGDYLTRRLYVPYLHMLAALSRSSDNALLCYRFLLRSLNPLVTWDHFFGVLRRYWADFENDDGSGLEISPDDVDALLSMLDVIEQVAKNSAETRTVMVSHSEWQVIPILFGLLSCPVQPVLKAALLRAIEAFSRGPSNDAVMIVWQYIETCGILPPVTGEPVGILHELQDVESRIGEYPETLAFVQLLNTLLDKGWRPAVYGNAVSFVRDNVLGKHGTRVYRKPAEPWLIASAALGTLLRVARDYEQEADTAVELTEPSPAFDTVRLFMDSSSVVLRTVLALINTGSAALEGEAPADYTAAIASAVVKALQLLSSLLHLQSAFSTHLRTVSAPPVPAALDLALVRAPDVVQAVGSLAGHPNERIGIAAVQLLHLLSLRQPQVASLFTRDTLTILISACSDRLENGSEETVDEDDTSITARGAVLALLLDTLTSDASAPSLAHLLLGFTVTWAPDDGHGKGPVVLELDQSTGPTCLHAVLALLETDEDPVTLAVCAELLYHLCADSESSTAALTHLRERDKMGGFALHRLIDIASRETGDTMAHLDTLGYLLRTVVVDLRAAAQDTTLRPYVQAAIAMLLGMGTTDRTMWLLVLLSAIQLPVGVEQPDLSLLANSMLLTGIDISRWRYSHPRTGVVLHDISGLHHMLTVRKREMEGTWAVQHGQLAGEIDAILRAAAAFNARSEIEGAACRSFDAWRALLEVTTSVDLVKGDAIGHAQLTILHAILQRAERADYPDALRTSYARAALCLAAGLRASRKRGAPAAPAQLHIALNGVVTLICSPGWSGVARGSMYAAMLDLLRYIDDDKSDMLSREFAAGNVSIVEASLTQLVERMSRDANEGPAWSRAAALAVLSGIIDALGSHGAAAVTALVRTGLLQQTLRDASSLDLGQVMGPTVEALRRVFLHEQRWSLLLRCAVAPNGAQCIAEQGALPMLCEAAYLDQRPDEPANRSQDTPWLATQPPIDRYRLIALPALRLALALVSGLSRSKSVGRQCVAFIQSHSELISSILHQRGPWDTGSLEETWLVVSLFGALARYHPDIHNTLRSDYSTTLAAMWPMIVTLCEEADAKAEAGDESASVEMRSRIHEICRTLLLYYRSLAEKDRLVFAPVLSLSGKNTLNPPLSSLLSYIRCGLRALHATTQQLRSLRMPLDDFAVGGEWDGTQQHTMSETTPSRDLSRLIRCVRAGIEASVVVIWRHVDLLLHGVAKLSDADGREFVRACSSLAIPLLQELIDMDEVRVCECGLLWQSILGSGKDLVHTAALRVKGVCNK